MFCYFNVLFSIAIILVRLPRPGSLVWGKLWKASVGNGAGLCGFVRVFMVLLQGFKVFLWKFRVGKPSGA